MIRSRGRFAVSTLLISALSAASSGCCAVSEYFCGPDDSEWVQVSFESPSAAVQTVREALRRDDPEVLYRCIGQSYKKHLGIGGSLEWAIIWGKIKEQVPAIHLMGNGSVSEPELLADSGRVRYVLERAGYRVAAEFEKVAFYEVLWSGPDPTQPGGDAEGDFVGRLRRPMLSTTSSEPGEPQQIRMSLEFNEFGDPVPSDQIVRAGVGHEWKIFDLRPLDDA